MNPLDISKEFGDFKKFNEELAKTATLTSELLTNSKNLTTELGKTKGLTEQNKKRTQAQENQNDIKREGNKLIKKKNDLVAKLTNVESEANKQLIKTQEAYKAKIKAQRDAIKESKKQKQAEFDLVKEINKVIKTERQATEQNKRLREARKDLDTTTKKGSLTLSLINKQLDKNNKLIKTQADADKKRTLEIGNYNNATTKTNELISSLIENTGAMGASIGGAIAKVKGLGAQFSKLLLNPIVATFAAIAAAVFVIGKAISRTKRFQDGWERSTESLNAAWTTFLITVGNTGSGGWANFWDNMNESVRLTEYLTKKMQELRDEQIKQNPVLNRLAIKQQAYQTAADDATLSFQNRQKFAEKAYTKEVELSDRQIKLTKQALVLQKTAFDDRIKQGDVLLPEEEKLLSELRIAYDNAIAKRKFADINYSKFKRELALDDFEQELDFIFDVGDKRKTANEKDIADTRKTQKERQSILNDTNQLLDESFNDQIDLFNSFHNLQIDTNKLLTLNNKESFEYARSLGMSERATNRLLEVIRERIAATSDLAEAQKTLRDLDDVDSVKGIGFEAVQTTKEIEENKTDIVAKNIEDRIKLNAAGLKKMTDDEKLYNETRLQLISSIKQQEWDITNTTGNALFDYAQNQRDYELSAIQNDYAAKIEAAEGDNELQIELQAKLEAEQLRIRQEQAKSERNQALFNLAITTAQKAFEIKAQAAVLSSNPITAALAPLALTQLGLLLSSSAISAALIASQPIPGFFKGTENAPAGLAWVAEKGAELIDSPNGESLLVNEPTLMNLQGGEKIKTAQETQQILNKAIYNDIAVNGNEGIESRLDKLYLAIKNKKELHASWDARGFGLSLSQGISRTHIQNKKGRR